MQGDARCVPPIDPVVGGDEEHPFGCRRNIVDRDRERAEVPGAEDRDNSPIRSIPEDRLAVEELDAPERVDPDLGDPR